MKFEDYSYIQALSLLLRSISNDEAVVVESIDGIRSKGDIKEIVQTAVKLTGNARAYTVSWAGTDQRALVIALKQ